MAQSFDSVSRKIGEILGPIERRPVVVPKFQRGFSWEKQHVITFWNDVLTFRAAYEAARKNATYFFGPIVIQDDGDEIHLLDGQQRLATATILLACIRDAARRLHIREGYPHHNLAYEIQANLIQKEDSDPPFALQLGELDSDYFRRTIQEDPPAEREPTLRSHELIRNAYRTLSEELQKSIDGMAPEVAVKFLKQMKDSLEKGMLLVAIDVDSEDDAYSIFETLNDRGLRLSVPDLLLNLLMRRAATDGERRKVRHQWNYMLEQMGRRDIARFLRHMWLSRYGDLKARSLFNELKEHLRTQEISSPDFAEACSLDCDYYVALLDQTRDIPAEAKNAVAGLVRYLGVTSSLPLLLAGIQCLNAPHFADLAECIASLAVRYSLIADLNPSTLESAFYEAARDMRTGLAARQPSATILATAKRALARLDPSDALVIEKAELVTLERAAALWTMTQIARHMQSETGELDVGNANLEHIFPRSPTEAQWPNTEQLAPLLWRLGNLTILGEDFNRSASNRSFATKTANYYRNSELRITNSIPEDHATWTPDDVLGRTRKMAAQLAETFSV